ncbi:c-type cytochrome [Inquilinus sp. Marseille-Q2685]|uniref:c-type cytochrome n=1 Tax=Inquilinus sp. Marseille-Q2685 TaxID=2866581 RepID=UPI0027295320|nr:c-type cytochrome [Inquilinus sp. Marseille-Q2685]
MTTRRIAGTTAGILGALLLLASGAWWFGESRWGRFEPLTPEQAFADGTLGLELAPLKYLLVAGTVSRHALEQQGGPAWPERFGFLPRSPGAEGRCAADAPGNLPVGFGVSNRLPGSASPVPVRFVGLTCAACHSTAVGDGPPILGAGTHTADVIGFADAFQNAVLDPGLTAGTILDAYDRQCPGEASGPAGWAGRQVEAFFIGEWLDGARTLARLNATKYELPFHGEEIGDPENIPTGPSRTRPFRSVVRNVLDLPGDGNVAYSKVPLVAMQENTPWSQFDGSIGDPVVRSMVAVFTSGASLAALDDPQIADNIRKAAAYTLRLGDDPPLPKLAEAFPTLPRPSAETMARGRAVYGQHCAACHGVPDGAHWTVSEPSPGEPSIAPLADIGTDPARMTFRHADMLPTALATLLPATGDDLAAQRQALQDRAGLAARGRDLAQADWWLQAIDRFDARARQFPAGHSLAFDPRKIAMRAGYLNAPLPFLWLRAPYLHNGSVPNLRGLIGLEDRPTRFCRGRAGYDPAAVGLAVVEPVDGHCPPQAGFLFDTEKPGNSNKGHEYPPRDAVPRPDLEALLAYLGTL